MDDLKFKFGTLLSKASNTANKLTKKKFTGQGHRLGTGEEHCLQPPQAATKQPVGSSRSHSTAYNRSAGQHSEAAAAGPGASQQSVNAQPAPAAKQLQPASEFSPFKAVIGSGAALGANRDPAAAAATSNTSTTSSSQQGTATAPYATARAAGQCLAAAGSSSPQHVQQQSAPVSADQLEQLQHCLALVLSQPAAAGSSMEVLSKLLSNLIATPQEAKFRHIRLSNPKIQQTLVQVAGALEFLAAVGFEIHTAENQAGSADESGFAVFLDDSQLVLVQEGLQQLQRVLPTAQTAQQQQQQQQQLQQPGQAATAAAEQTTLAPQPAPQPAAAPKAAAVAPSTHKSAAGHTPMTGAQPSISASSAAASSAAASSRAPAASTSPPPAASSVARSTQVLLPATPDTEVPEWFFERAGVEVKAEYMAMLKARQTGQLIASKTFKNAQLGRKAGAVHTVATVRIRFPEGVCLQGFFHVSETVTAVFEWVSQALRHPGITFELIKPDRKQLQFSGCVGDADLAPAVLLNFRPLSGRTQVPDREQRQSFIRDELLLQAQAD